MILNKVADYCDLNRLVIIGQGTYGVIYYNKKDNNVIKIYKETGYDYDTLRELLAYNYLNKIKDSPCPKINNYIINPLKSAIVMNKYEYTLNKLPKNLFLKHFDTIVYKLLFYLCTWGIYGFAHRDIKSNNIVCTVNLDDTIDIKIIDWGSARFRRLHNQDIPLSVDLGTTYSRSPESLYFKLNEMPAIYDPIKSDIWSVAITLCFNYFSNTKDNEEFMFNDKNKFRQYKKLKYYLKTTDKTFLEVININFDNPLLNDLINKMLIYNPIDRIDIEGIVNHEYFAKEKNNILSNVKLMYNKKTQLCDKLLDELRINNYHDLINNIKSLKIKDTLLSVLLSCVLIDHIIYTNKLIINKTLYHAVYCIISNVFNTESVYIPDVAFQAKISCNNMISYITNILKNYINIYDILSTGPIINIFDNINNFEFLKISLILFIYYPHVVYNEKNDVYQLVKDIYEGAISIKELKPIVSYDITIVENL